MRTEIILREAEIAVDRIQILENTGRPDRVRSAAVMIRDNTFGWDILQEENDSPETEREEEKRMRWKRLEMVDGVKREQYK